VLLRELPDYIRKSIEAYIGCLSGAIMKDEYIAMIEKAGFQNVKVINEASFPIELMASDPTGKTIMKNLRLTAEKVKGIADSVVSISIQAKR
jgi:arsenite methyltransferase